MNESRRVGAGGLRVGFQRLSRLDDEYGTGRVYERLGDSAGTAGRGS